MLEFLTLLPQECEDAAAAAQPASAEHGWALKARAHEWSPEVAAWLHSVHSSSSSSAVGGGPSCSPGAAAAGAGELLTLAVLRCFAAWVKWGCLQYVEARHAAYFASLAGELLFASEAARGQPFHPLLLPAAVDAATEIIEHASEELQPLLLQLAGALPARAAALRASGAPGAEEAAEELCHVFALFCSTHCALCAAEGPEGEALRQVGGKRGQGPGTADRGQAALRSGLWGRCSLLEPSRFSGLALHIVSMHFWQPHGCLLLRASPAKQPKPWPLPCLAHLPSGPAAAALAAAGPRQRGGGARPACCRRAVRPA